MRPFKFFQGKSINNEIGGGYELYGVTPIMYCPTTFEPVRALLYRNATTGTIMRGEVINTAHELWDHNQDEIPLLGED